MVSLQICPRSKATQVAALLGRTAFLRRNFIYFVKLLITSFIPEIFSVTGATEESQLQYTLSNPFLSNLYGVDGEQTWALLHGLWLKTSVDSGWGSLRSYCQLLALLLLEFLILEVKIAKSKVPAPQPLQLPAWGQCNPLSRLIWCYSRVWALVSGDFESLMHQI